MEPRNRNIGRARGLGLMLAVLVIGWAGSGRSPAWAAPALPLRIVATTGMVADIVREVAGTRAEVTALLGEGVDPHLYRPTRSDIVQLMRADLVFYSGLLLEGKMTEALERAAASGRPVLAVTEGLAPAGLISPEGFQGHPDPHVWMDVALWMKAVEAVRNRLSVMDPAGAAVYSGNASAYLERLAALDAYARLVMDSIPAGSRVLVTAHDAFNYLGRAYGIAVRGIQGISTESEAGLRELEELVRLLVERRIGAVFTETSVSERNVRALVDGAAARGHQVLIGGKLYSDALGAPGSYEGTYIGMIEHNVTTIALGLGGTVPASGFRGRQTSELVEGRAR